MHTRTRLHIRGRGEYGLHDRTGRRIRCLPCVNGARRKRLFVGPITIPFPRFFSGDAYVRESYNDKLARFEVDVSIDNPFWGKILGYRGTFELDRISCTPDEIPDGTIPVRESKRE